MSGHRFHDRELTGSDRFAILGRLGEGGMGVVYRALDRARGTEIALKTLRRVNPATVYRLKREFRALADIHHPNLVSLYELISADDRWFVTMELVDGVNFLDYVRPETGAPSAARDRGDVQGIEAGRERGNLIYPEGCTASSPAVGDALEENTLIDRNMLRILGSGNVSRERAKNLGQRPLDLSRLRFALRQLAEGVHALHSAGKLHRDIKPSNVMITCEGRVVLLDFGLVTELDGRNRDHVSTVEHIVGTVGYMAPEQASVQAVSFATDWYSVGVMLFEALVGARPFVGSPVDVLVEKQKVDAPAPIERAEQTPEDLNRLCVDLLRRDPRSRPSGREILQRLGVKGAAPPLGIDWSKPSGAGESVLIGREGQLVELTESYLATRQGRAVMSRVHGPSGMGKTALVRHFLEHLTRRTDALVFSGRCYERESLPFKAFDSLIDSLCRYLRLQSDEEVERLLPEDVGGLTRLFPVLSRVKGIRARTQQYFWLPDPQELRRRAFAALRELFDALSGLRPVVLAVDDLQWGDRDSALLFSELFRGTSPPSILFIACYRSEDAATSAFLSAIDALPPLSLEVRNIALGPLTDEEACRIALSGLEAHDAASRAEALEIARESGGNPFFVDALVHYARRGGRAGRSGRDVELAGGDALVAQPDAAPTAPMEPAREPAEMSLTAVLWGRVSELPMSARKLLEVVAVGLGPLPRSVVFDAASVGGDAEAALAALRAAHLVRTRAGADDESDEIETYHDRIRGALLERMAGERLVEIHRALARALESSDAPNPEALAIHLKSAGERTRAAMFSETAADRARHALAFDQAAKLYRLALELQPNDGARSGEIGAKLASSLAALGRGLEAAEAFLSAARASRDLEGVSLRRRAAEQLLRSGHVDRGIRELEAVLSHFDLTLSPAPGRVLVSLLSHRARARVRGFRHTSRGESEISRADLERMEALWSAATGLAMVDNTRASVFQTRYLLCALDLGEPRRLARALSMEVCYSATEGSGGRARTAKILERAEKLAETLGEPEAFGLFAMASSAASLLEGRFADARLAGARAEQIFRGECSGVAWEIATAQVFHLLALAHLGELGTLTRFVEKNLREAEERDDRYAAGNLRSGLGNLAWLRNDDVEAARDQLDSVTHHLPGAGFHIPHYYELLGRGNLELYLGRGIEAWRVVQSRWADLERSLVLRIQYVRVQARDLRARCALAAAASSDGGARAQLVGLALEDASRIEREAIGWGAPLASLICAGAAELEGDDRRAKILCRQAIVGFESAGMRFSRAGAMRALGAIEERELGRALEATANGWMLGQGVARPASMSRIVTPWSRSAEDE